ncbi:MAG: hypothetical protein IPM93_24960 [Candidatus Obscuribacter sp.]|nr:hypothetical protein [Candidatus Obscuribacter sp.]
MFSLEGPWQESVKKLGISPRENLRIVACDSAAKQRFGSFRRQRLRSGHGSLRFRRIPRRLSTGALQGHAARDGAVFHRNPDQFCQEPA